LVHERQHDFQQMAFLADHGIGGMIGAPRRGEKVGLMQITPWRLGISCFRIGIACKSFARNGSNRSLVLGSTIP
jgi:hypothetical protein